MSGKQQFICLTLLICILFGSGCHRLKQMKAEKSPKEIEQTTSEKQKAKLLRKINRRYENPQTHFELGRIYQSEGLWVQAERQYNIALNLNPVHRQAQAARIKVLMNSGDNPKAELLAEVYIEQATTSAIGSLNLALGFQEQGLDDYALTCYQQALRLNPNSAKINRQVGYYYLSKNDLVRAQEYLTRSFQLNPNQPNVAGQLGRLGVTVKIPTKKQRGTRKLDKTIDRYDKELTQ